MQGRDSGRRSARSQLKLPKNGTKFAASPAQFVNANNNTLNPIVVRLIRLWFLGTTVLAAVGGTIWLAYTFWFVDHAARAQGQIVGMRSRPGQHDTEYAPVFTFSDADGVTHTQVCPVSSSSYSYETGEKVAVLYDPARPVHANIDSFETIWLFPLVVVGVSLVSGSFLVIFFFVINRMVRAR